MMINLLDVASSWLTNKVTAADIEHERQQLEADYHVSIAVHDVGVVMRSGVPCTRVEWKIVEAGEKEQ